MGFIIILIIIATDCAFLTSAVESEPPPPTVLDGYLRRGTDGSCFRNMMGSPAMVAVNSDVPTDCTKVRVIGDGSAGYTIETSGEANQKFTLDVMTEGTALTLSGTTTLWTFVTTEDTAACGAELKTLFLIEILSSPVKALTASNCLKTDLTYTNVATTCDDAQGFYFETIDCSGIPDCSLCYDDGELKKCSACENSKIPSISKTQCEDCANALEVPDACGIVCIDCNTAMDECTTCTAHNVCTACIANTKALNADDTECIDCDVAIPSCMSCASIGGINTCTACIDDGTVLNSAADMCITCGAAITDCIACSVYDTCETCCHGKVPNSNADTCITCADAMTNCTTCSNFETCSACTAGEYVPNANGNGCMACTSPEIANEGGNQCVACSDAIPDCPTCTSYQTCTSCDNIKVLNPTGTMCEDLQGYLVSQDGVKCFGIDGSDPAVVKPDSSTDIPTDCTKVKLSDHDLGDYVLSVASDNTKQLTFAVATDATPLTLTTTGTALKFVASGNVVTEADSLLDSDAPVLVVQSPGANGGQECMLDDLTYENTDVITSCVGKGWYIVLACDTIDDCKTCSLNSETMIKCTSCGSDKIVSGNECQSCKSPEVPNADGTACEDESSGSDVIVPMHIGVGILMVVIGKIMA